MIKFEMFRKDGTIVVRRTEDKYCITANYVGNEMTYYLIPIVTIGDSHNVVPEAAITRRLTGDFVHCIEQLEMRMDTICVKTVHDNGRDVSTHHMAFNGIESAICTIIDTANSTVEVDTKYKGCLFSKTFTIHIAPSGSIIMRT